MLLQRRVPKSEQTPAKSPLGQFKLIASRPAPADGRGEVGQLGGDLIIGAGGRSAIVTVSGRASCHVWLADLPDNHSAEATLAGPVKLVERIRGQLRLMLTWDSQNACTGLHAHV